MSTEPTQGEQKRPRHSIWAHIALLDPSFICCAPGCSACAWYRARGGWAHDDSMEEYLDGMR